MLAPNVTSGTLLLYLLSDLGVPPPPWPVEAEDFDVDSAWIPQAEAYALGVRLLRLQLRHGEENIKIAVDRLLRHLVASAGINGWDKWLIATIWPEVNMQVIPANWIFLSMANENLRFSPSQFLGAIITLAADQELATAMSGIRCLSVNHRLERDKIAILLRLAFESYFASYSFKYLVTLNATVWLKELGAHKTLAALLKALAELSCDEKRGSLRDVEWSQLTSKIFDSNLFFTDAIIEGGLSASAACLGLEIAEMLVRSGKQTEGLQQIEQLVKASNIVPPPGAQKSSWQQLFINSALNSTRSNHDLLLIESKSLPRSGHHYLKSVLQAIGMSGFSYCEMYQEPGCCKVFPCNAEPFWNDARCEEKGHLRMVKSHDFQLSDPVYDPPPGVIRIVQVRQPCYLLSSWLELAQLDLNKALLANHGVNTGRIYLYHEKPLLDLAYKLIDDCGITMSPHDACAWIQEKTKYITQFSQKWFPLCKPVRELPASQSGTFLLRYEDLGLAPRLLSRLSTSQPDSKCRCTGIPEFTPRSSPITARRSKRVSRLLCEVDSVISESESVILRQWTRWDNLIGDS